MKSKKIKKKTDTKLVYFAEKVGAGLVKIGVSDDPFRRVRKLKSESTYPLHLICVADGGYSQETRLHNQFNAYRMGGEYFYFRGDLRDSINNRMIPATLIDRELPLIEPNRIGRRLDEIDIKIVRNLIVIWPMIEICKLYDMLARDLMSSIK